MSERILTAGEVAAVYACAVPKGHYGVSSKQVAALCDSHEALRKRVAELEAKLDDFRAELPW